MILYVQQTPRKDGKYKAVYVFPIQDRKINKLITKEDLAHHMQDSSVDEIVWKSFIDFGKSK